MRAFEGNLERIFISAVKKGGRIVKDGLYRGSLNIRKKTSFADLVTDVDTSVQEAVVEMIEKELPGVPIVAEESHTGGEYPEAVYIDPIDGTLNFVHGYSECAVSIGYWKDDRPIAGAVYNPLKEDIFFAQTGQGAFRNGKPIQVSENRTVAESLVSAGWPYDRTEIANMNREILLMTERSQEVRIVGSAALSLCYVAAGIFDGYWEWGLMPWDMAGGAAIAWEAGARLTSIENGSFELQSGTVIATNGLIHQEMVRYLSKTDQ